MRKGMARVSKSQRNKGAAFEREVCATFSAMLGREVKRHLGQARDSGEDIDLGWAMVECKRRKTLKVLYSWFTQVRAAVNGKVPRTGFAVPVVPLPTMVVRADGEPALFVCKLEDLELVARYIFRALEVKDLLS